jgi:hypothetical protein
LKSAVKSALNSDAFTGLRSIRRNGSYKTVQFISFFLI